MNRLIVLLVAAAALVALRCSIRAQDAEPAEPSDARVVALGFSPSKQCTEIETKLVAGAQKEVLVQAYGFTSEPVYEALDAAKARGVDVEVILDRSNKTQKKSGRLDIEHHDIPTWIDSKHPIAHNKVTIVDGRFVETGSYNYSHQAELNAENCIVLDDAALAADYRANWKSHQIHSEQERR